MFLLFTNLNKITMLPETEFEFAGSQPQNTKFHRVRPARDSVGLQPAELLPLIIALITYIILHHRIFYVKIIVQCDDSLITQILNEIQAIIRNKIEPIKFTTRQMQIISLARQGYSVKEMSREMKISDGMVTRHRKKIYNILQDVYNKPRTIASIVWYAHKAGIN